MNIKKLLSLGLISVLSVGILAGCSSKDAGKEAPKTTETKKIVVGATPVPHAEFLNGFAKAKLKEKGIDLEVKEFTDYVIPNKAVAEKQLDANYFQHIPYLDDYNKENKTTLVPIGKIHAEPLAAYSNKIKNISELKSGAIIAIPNDNSNGTRALKLLQKQGLIELKDANAAIQTEKDIVKNPKNIKVKTVEAAQLPRVLGDVDVAIINGNYALESKLDTKSTLFAEDVSAIEKNVNVVVSREDNKDNPALKELVNVLKSEDAKKWLKEKYGSAVIPAN
ncbi:MetQ/NlpA family ABC transporter substrate-binding protein [Clostridium cylindrosporum]|uniref:Lipoprotein n=1 Tax=Clostridium cylindrosporum DSM 605 TaxID=1121307 RepID=A0A0J8D4T5_CLOCY|nr:MetQ/NlpA family ABC transporter substrate-binding protein [Clostridium cylindrosporum]KMT21175.1 putative D-methionine-binding lipoprotein MetQ [Clostridium cylindrosporum DSM 605]